jgi:hypothetical protein
MKLFVWADPYKIRYGSSALFAVAETEEQARALAINAPRYAYVRFKKDSGAKAELGPPTRIVELPCAEWHEWEE